MLRNSLYTIVALVGVCVVGVAIKLKLMRSSLKQMMIYSTTTTTTASPSKENEAMLRQELRQELREEVREELLEEMKRSEDLTLSTTTTTTTNTNTTTSALVNCGNQTLRSVCGDCPVELFYDDDNKQPQHIGCRGDCIWDSIKLQCVDKPETFTAFDVLIEDQVTYLHQVLETVTKTLQQHNVTYWISDGTLLAAMRNKPPGIFRWDDDLDMAILDREAERLEFALSKNPEIVWKREGKAWDGWRVGLASFDETKRDELGRQHCMDIFKLQKKDCHDDGSSSSVRRHRRRWHAYSTHQKQCKFTSCFYTDKDVAETRPCQFWDLTVQCPIGTKNFLDHCYNGPSAFERARVRSHRLNGIKHMIDLQNHNLNDHEALLPGLDKALADKLLGNANYKAFYDDDAER